VAAPAPSVAFTEFEITIPAPGDFRSGSNVHRQASDHAAGDELIPAGRRLRSAEIAVAATCGAAQVQVAARPKVAVIATGDELAEVGDRELASHHVRKSNDYALRAALALDGLTGPIERLHLRDEWPEIEAGLARALAEYDVVILTGGVSRGRFDHVPAVLAALGVEAKIGGVAQRPGKPMSFGVSPGGVPVFALPGNPVSACVCLHRYVLPALRRMAGAPAPNAEFVTLGKAVTFSPPLTYFLPVRVESRMDGSRIATPEPFNTSGDVGGLLQTDGFVELAAESNMFSPGLTVRFWRWA
ncbi:MAG TPA: molybdopterin molybdotransferase MoeA, partial [Candidatus Synoicihabitans sp.]|nr:molybdopterin molybdotransferase MoeA [Candidatus Synoicihabitans sp.]